jgi:SNF2 family DNA or RNA helicase
MAWAEQMGDQLWIGAARAESGLCLQIPGCTLDQSDGIWKLPLTWPGLVAMRAVWSQQPVELGPGLLAWEAAKWAEVQERYSMRMAMDAPEPLATQLIAMEDGGDLHLDGSQRGAVAWLERWRRCIVGDPMGNGKTPPLIRTLQLLGPEALPAVVICPDSAPLAWARKIASWAPDLRVQVVTGTALARRRALSAEADVYILLWSNIRYHTRLASYPSQRFTRCTEHGGIDEKITPARCEVHPKELNGMRIATVIADECHRMAKPQTKQSRAVQWLAHHAENFWAVTGTMTASDVGDLWPVLHAIDPKGWPVRTRYLDLYGQQEYSWHGGAEVTGLRPETAGYFHVAVEPLFRRIPLRTGRPERTEPEFRYPQMVPAQARLYKQLSRDLMTDLPTGHTMVPDNSAVKFTRLVQLASSAIEIVPGEDAHGYSDDQVKVCLPSNKADDLLEFLADNEGQWIVSCFSPDLVGLCARKLHDAGVGYEKIIGGMSGQEKDQAALLFQANPLVRVMFLTAAGGESIDLQAARGVVFLQPNPSFVMREQIIGRADRRGAVHPVRTVYMISPGTVDDRLYELGCIKDTRHAEVTRDAELMRWVITAGELTDAG